MHAPPATLRRFAVAPTEGPLEAQCPVSTESASPLGGVDGLCESSEPVESGPRCAVFGGLLGGVDALGVAQR